MSSNVDKKYQDWCEKIANSADYREIIFHLREHICEHFKRDNNRESDISLKKWVVGTLNFMEILEKQFPDITDEDKLYKLCKYYRDKEKGPKASFDSNKFMDEYRGDMI